MNLISLARYSSGIQSSVSTWPPDWTYSRNSCVARPLAPPYRTIVRHRAYHVHPPDRAHAPGRPALRREGLPRHVDRRPRGGDGRPEGLALRAHRRRSRTCSTRRCARAPRAFHAALDAIPDDLPADGEDPARAARAPARRRRAARRRDRLRPRVALPRGRAARGDPRRAAPLRGALPRALPRGPRARRAAHRPRRRARPRCSSLSAANWAYTWLQPGRDTDALADRFCASCSTGMRGYATPRSSAWLGARPDRQPVRDHGVTDELVDARRGPHSATWTCGSRSAPATRPSSRARRTARSRRSTSSRATAASTRP